MAPFSPSSRRRVYYMQLAQDGYVRVWDMQTKTFIRTVIVQEVSTRLLVVLFVDVLIACRMWT